MNIRNAEAATLQEREEYLADLHKHLTRLADDLSGLAEGIRTALTNEQETVRFVLDKYRIDSLYNVTDSQGRVIFNALPIFHAANGYSDTLWPKENKE